MRISLFLAIAALLTAVSAVIWSGESTGTAQPSTPSANVSVVLVLDNSGSMQANDPDDLRFAAGELFVRLLDEGDRVGLVVFADNVERSVELQQLRDQAAKESFADDLTPIPPKGNTNMLAAFKEAALLLQRDTSSNERVIVFLTDGRPEIEGKRPGDPDFDPWWGETLQTVSDLGVSVLAIGLTTGGQTPYLSQLVAASGRGQLFDAAKSEDLPASYLAVFGHLKGRTVFEPEQGPDEGARILNVGPSIRRMHAVVVGQNPAASLAIDGSPLPAVTWSEGRFSVLTVGPQQGGYVPPGTWTVTADPSADVRAIAVSQFEIQILEPAGGVVPSDKTFVIEARVTEVQADGRIARITPDSFEVSITRPDGAVDKPTLVDSGAQGDQNAGDLVYSFQYAGVGGLGDTTLEFLAFRSGVPISLSRSVEALPFPSVVLEEPATDQLSVKATEGVEVVGRVQVDASPVDLAEGVIEVDVTNPDGETEALAIDVEANRFSAVFTPELTGVYRIEARWSGVFHDAVTSDIEVRTIDLAVSSLVLLDLDSLDFGTERELALPVQVFAPGPVALQAQAVGQDITVTVEPDQIPPGASEVRLKIDEDLGAGTHSFDLVFTSSPDVDVEPARIAASLRVPSFWDRFASVVKWVVIVLIVAAFIVAVYKVVSAKRFDRDAYIDTPLGKFMLGDIQGGRLKAALKQSLTMGREEDDVPLGIDATVAKVRPLGGTAIEIVPEDGDRELMSPGSGLNMAGVEITYGIMRDTE